MRNMLALIAVLVILFAGLGACRSWYTLETQPALSGKFAFRVEVDIFRVGTDMIQAGRWIFAQLARADQEKAKQSEKTD